MDQVCCSCVTALLIYSVVILLALIVVTFLNVTSSAASCKNVRTVEKIQEVSHKDILNYDASRNTNEEPVKDSNTVYCDCGKRNMFTVFECVVIATVIVFFLYVTAAVVSQYESFYLKRKAETEELQKERSF